MSTSSYPSPFTSPARATIWPKKDEAALLFVPLVLEARVVAAVVVSPVEDPW
jgi:hypothetical protein